MKFYFFVVRFFILIPFVFASVSAEAGLSIPGNPKDFKILTLNVYQFPKHIVSKENDQRAEKLVETILQRSRLHQDWDIIAIQELWSNKTRNWIYERIHSLYPFHTVDQRQGAWGGLGLHSGLAIFSKHPITRSKIVSYQHKRGWENFAQKGVLAAEIQVGPQTVYVFNTHLQAGPGGSFFQWLDRGKPSTREIARLSLETLAATAEDFIQDKNAVRLLTGDLNINAGSQEYSDAIQFLQALDTFDPISSSYRGTSWNDFPTNTRIDYILDLNVRKKGKSVIIDSFGPAVTDHLGVEGAFDFEA